MNILENIMNLRQVIHIYECKELYLYEIIEDYKNSNDEEKDEIFNSFCSSIWSCDNKRRTYKKTISFKVRKDLLDSDVGQVFDAWSQIDYMYYKSMTKDETWYSLIRQKINNIYTRYCDKEIIIAKEYMDLIKKPKTLYYQWISGIDMDSDELTNIIDDAIADSIIVKEKYQKQKIDLSWSEYKEVVNGFLRRCFDNCKLIGDYEDKTKMISMFDFFTEDHFYVSYFCKTLDGYIKDYEKKISCNKTSSRKGFKRCKMCGAIIESTGNKKMYCSECAKINTFKNKKRWDNFNRIKNPKNRNFQFYQ